MLEITAADLYAASQRLKNDALLQALHKAQPTAALGRLGANPMAYCGELAQRLRQGRYHAGALQAMHLTTSSVAGKPPRQLLLPPLADRLVQSALAWRLSAALEPSFSQHSYAYRPNRGVKQACAALRALLQAQPNAWVVDADIRQCFDHIAHPPLLAALRRLPQWQGQTAFLLRQFLRSTIAPAPKQGFAGASCLVRGLPQGSPLSPLLCNVALHPLDQALSAQGLSFVRYADDFVVLAADQASALAVLKLLVKTLAPLGLRLNHDKTHCHPAAQGFRFLGQAFGGNGTSSHIEVNQGEAHLQSQPKAMLQPSSSSSPRRAAAQPILTTASRASTAVDIDTAIAANPQPVTQPPPDLESTLRPSAEPLLRTLYLLEHHTTLERDGQQLVVRSAGKADERIPAARLHQVFAFAATNFTSGAIALCLEHSIPVMVLSGRGRYFGVIDPLSGIHIETQRAQFSAMAQPATLMALARGLIRSKLANSVALLKRWHRRRPIAKSEQCFEQLHLAQQNANRAESVGSLRGIEGAAAHAYWQALASIIEPQWQFTGRRKQPPPDPVNALLSYGYTMLYYNMLNLVMARGLNPYLGCIHTDRRGHHALVSDLIEPFRAPIVDALVFDVVQNWGLKPEDFSWPDEQETACLMNTQTRRQFVQLLEQKLNTPIRHAQHGLLMDWRRIMDAQVQSLAQHLLDPSQPYSDYVIKP